MLGKSKDTGFVIHVRFDKEQHAALKRYATAHQRPVSQAVKVLATQQLKAEKYIK